jgi:hypothetical protein
MSTDHGTAPDAAPRAGWARHQEEFRDGFAKVGGALPKRPVLIRWWTPGETTGQTAGLAGVFNLPYWGNLTYAQIAAIGVGAVLLVAWFFLEAVPLVVRIGLVVLALAFYLLKRGGPLAAHRPQAGHVYVAIYPLASFRRTPPKLVFEVDPTPFEGRRQGEGQAIVVGRMSPNGHFCLLQDRVTIWPVRNPVRRMPGAPGR